MLKSQDRQKQIKEIAYNNARSALDQKSIESYCDNMIDSLVEHFSDLTMDEMNTAQRIFANIIKSCQQNTAFSTRSMFNPKVHISE